MKHWSLDDLRNDVLNGTLPEVSWILPAQWQSEHPGAKSSPAKAGHFISQVLDAITANDASWSSTVLFLTFDENDGFFDHLPPPAVPSYNSDGTVAGKSTLSLEGEYFLDPARAHLAASDTITGNIRPVGHGSAGPHVRSFAMDERRLGQLAGLRSHIVGHVSGKALRHRGRKYQSVASGGLRRSDFSFRFLCVQEPVPGAAGHEQLRGYRGAPAPTACSGCTGRTGSIVPGDGNPIFSSIALRVAHQRTRGIRWDDRVAVPKLRRPGSCFSRL